MARLKIENIDGIISGLDGNDEELVKKTGCNLRGVVCHALGIADDALQAAMAPVKIAVVPQESDQAADQGLSKAIAEIVRHIGFKAFITGESNIAGIAEAAENGAGVIMMGDDRRFVALNIKTGRLVDNSVATAKGYVAGLDLMAGGLKGKKVFITGCGTVGWNAALTALNRGAEVSTFDIDFKRTGKLAGDMKELTGRGVSLAVSLKSGLWNHQLIMETTNAAEIIEEESIKPGAYIAAPGLPLGLTPAAIEKVSDKLLHDQMQIGVAVMAVEAVVKGKS